MSHLRRHLEEQRVAAIFLVVLVVLMRVLVPAGFKPSADRGTISLEVCSGLGLKKIEIGVPLASVTKSGHPSYNTHQDKSALCGFSSISALAMPGLGPVLLVPMQS